MDPLIRRHFPPGTGESLLRILRVQVMLLGMSLWATASIASAQRLGPEAWLEADREVLTLPPSRR
ncbi:MAG: hypothetical protein JSR54_16660 [Proteobacteria bacterium]|nr:hypothetical protein [Pseudomonadota bacterium]